MKKTYLLSEIDQIAQFVIAHCNAKIILFYGEMAVGKTTLIKSIIKHLGSTDQVSSPTFSIVNEYVMPQGKAYHFDLYRIKHLAEALDFGLEEYLDSGHWVFIEWPELILPLLPVNYNIITLKNSPDHLRELTLSLNTN